ncbi:YihY/virulence factor BrkB family protein [Salinisphaera sp.]|uniref:YihY/virulence factor BrkB family protein n=1 Tax=Salinisphaera sp. TaxID=1914330 RepID=UPI002D795EE9|nr:YihY/virulence factor BrkB family protein [Salinisphaera sp.]HET7313817.1 YihY/virulence factor BrkB family protein [Salinisphaera sp.]
MRSRQAVLQDGRGRRAHTPLHIPLLGWKDVLLRVFHAFSDNNLSLIAAGASFYGLLAIFPGIAAFVAIYGLFFDPHNAITQMQGLSGLLPPDVIRTVTGQMVQIADRPPASLGVAALFTLSLALWSARRGTTALMTALNVVYAEKESRNLIVTTLISLALTLALILGLIGVALLAAGIPIIFAALGASGLAVAIGRGIGLGAGALLLMLGIAGMYRYAPSRARPKWRWVFVGAAIVTVFWIIGSLAFSVYLAFSDSYSATYGSIGAVVVVLTWLYITILIMLVGGEINAQLEFQTAEDTTISGNKPMGQRGAFVADNIAKCAEDIDFDAEESDPQ